ncbi:DNA translocase FtsK [Methylobacterium sp. WL12]|uniref:DNA translocase FtsK n=2 Tax=unclassified Methylobacterium TaxID=2615210 RepID=UPI001FEE5BDB|nr:DNA translocase FtsK [Methylobacterium sp. WL12]
MSLRASLTRRLVGGPQRPGYAIAGTRPAPSWLTPPNAMLGRGTEPGSDGSWTDSRAGRDAVFADAWPTEVFDDRATLDMLDGARPESRIDASASSPGVLVRSPRRPAAITPEDIDRPRGVAHAVAGASLRPDAPPAVRYTRTPDTILQERRQRALEAERNALDLARADAQAAMLAAAAERDAAAHEAEIDAERSAAEAERGAAEAVAIPPGPPLPLWRQPFVPPPGVRFFRTPDRRPSRPAVELSAATAPAPAEARDLSELPDWSDVQPWFEAGDWSSAEAWAAIRPGSAEGGDAAQEVSVAMPAEPAPADRFVSVPVDISHLRSLPPAPVYVLDRLVRFDRPLRPEHGQDNASQHDVVQDDAGQDGLGHGGDVVIAAAVPALSVRPALSLVFGPGTPLPSPAAIHEVRRAPVLSAMAARAAIRPARPTEPALLPAIVDLEAVQPEYEAAFQAAEPAFGAESFAPTFAPSLAMPAAAPPVVLPIVPRPVLLRGKAAPAPAPVEVAPVSEPTFEAPSEPVFEQALEHASEQAFEPVVEAPASPVAAMPVVGRPHLIAAGRHLAIASVENADYELPALDLLAMPVPGESPEVDADVLEQNALNLQQTVQDFGVRGDILAVRPGPVVTLYELEPAPGTKSSRVIGLSDDIARSMSAVSARVAVVPGRNVIGIELPNEIRETVFLRELLSAPDFFASKHKLALCLGKNIGGEPIIADLARMPHLLVAGTTGSGKSVAINTMILSLLYRMKPEECRLIMVDPKMLELSVYDGIPHLLSPVVIDPKKAVIALKWAVREMEERYKKMSKIAVRNIDGYNARMAEARAKGETITRTIQTGFNRETGEAVFEDEAMDLSPLPYIVIVVDEMADLMMVAGKDIEGAIQRLAQMARAAGIHLIMATQRPSVDVITGTIKANFPTRISFQVTSKIDSRTILGEMGAEQLLGQGDMLFMAGGGRTTRVHGPFCSDSEVESVVAHLKRQGRPAYLEAVTADDGSEDAPKGKGRGKAEAVEAEVEEADLPVFDVGAFVAASGGEAGDLYEQAIQVVLRDRKASTSYIQRRLQIGYNRAASIMERMEIEGIVGQANHAGKREILVEGAPHAASMYDDE